MNQIKLISISSRITLIDSDTVAARAVGLVAEVEGVAPSKLTAAAASIAAAFSAAARGFVQLFVAQGFAHLSRSFVPFFLFHV